MNCRSRWKVLLLTLAVAWPFAWLTGVVMDWWVIPKILPLAVAAIYAAGVIAVGASRG